MLAARNYDDPLVSEDFIDDPTIVHPINPYVAYEEDTGTEYEAIGI